MISRWAQWRVLALVGLAVLGPSPAYAHPHAWIDVRSVVMFDQRGHAVALEEIWLFDPYYTAFAIEGLDEDGDGAPDPDGLAALLRENMTNLAAYDYFTVVETDGTSEPLDAVTEMSSRMRGEQLEMRFVVTFAAPLLEKTDSFSYAIFDPTYYIEMLHASGDDAVRLVGAPEGCSVERSIAEPDAETVALAAMLDQSQTAGNGLGILFAETVTVQCPDS